MVNLKDYICMLFLRYYDKAKVSTLYTFLFDNMMKLKVYLFILFYEI